VLSVNSAKISWTTDILSNTIVYYGKTTDYGSIAKEDTQSSVINHSKIIYNLDQMSKYYYKLISQNSITNKQGEKIGSFTSSENFITDGNIIFSNIEIPEKYMINGNAKIIWNTSIPVSGYSVLWYDINSDEEYWHSSGGEYFDPRTRHIAILGNSENWKLKNGSLYKIRVCTSNHIEKYECSKEKQFTYKENTDINSKQIVGIENTATYLNNNQIDKLLAEIKQLRNQLLEQAAELKYLKNFVTEMKALNANTQEAIKVFITYGVDENTKKLGEGERAAVVSSYEAAFSKLPQTEEELADAIKIANGRFPSITNDLAEKKAMEQFIKIYKRVADLNDPQDNAAIKVMAYGLRQKASNRNLNSEKAGIKIFKAIFGHTPKTTEEWNTMQAITYSGASQEKDSDNDLLSDEYKKKLGTNPNKSDSDGDGFKDGDEVKNGYNPLGPGKLKK